MLFTYQLQWGYLEEGKLGLRIYPINFNIQKSIHILKYLILVPGIFSLDVHIHEYFFWIYPFERKTFHISWILKNCFLVYKAFPINYGLLGLPQLPITYSWNRFLLWFPSYLLLTLFFVVPFPYLLTVESFLITFPQLSYLFLGSPPPPCNLLVELFLILNLYYFNYLLMKLFLGPPPSLVTSHLLLELFLGYLPMLLEVFLILLPLPISYLLLELFPGLLCLVEGVPHLVQPCL